MAKIIQLRVVYWDEDKNIQGGINFLLPEGSEVVMYQEWEHTASGNVWQQVCPDPIGSQGLLEYFLSAWQDKHLDPYTEEVRHYEIEYVDDNWR